MKKLSVRSIVLLLVIVVMLTSVFALSVNADDGDYVKWTISGDNTQISNGEKMFYLYTTYAKFYLDPDVVYEFENEVDFTLDGDNYSNTVYSVSPNAEFIWVEDDYSYTYTYVTEEGKKQLDLFFAGNPDSFRIHDSNGDFADFNTEKIKDMDSRAASGRYSQEINVVALQTLPRYELIARDNTNTFSYEYGVVYLVEDGLYYYINYLTLGNNYFDADGNFSYRNGTVTVTVLDEALCSYIDDRVDSLDYFSPEYIYEDNGFSDSDKTVFWFIFVLVGFLAPIPFLVMGLVFPHSQKNGRPKYWYALAAIAAAWMFFAFALMIVMLI